MPGQPNRRDQTKREENQRKYAELRAWRDKAVQQGLVQHGVAPEEALQRVIDDSVLRYLEECKRNDDIRAAGGKVSDRRERALSRDVASYAQMALQYRLDDRRVSADEKRVALFMHMIEGAMRHPDIDLPPDKVKLLPGIMKENLLAMQTSGSDEKAGVSR